MEILVIGYGNTLRGDDGVGYRVAEHVAAWNLPQVGAIACHQLTPELAAAMAECDRVIFVDAALPHTQTTVTVKPLSTPSGLSLDTHHSSPEGLLTMAAQLYDSHPEAYQILLPTAEMEFSEALSAIAQTSISEALLSIRPLAHPESREPSPLSEPSHG